MSKAIPMPLPAKPKGGGSTDYLNLSKEGKYLLRVTSNVIDGSEAWVRSADSNTVHRQAEEFIIDELIELGVKDNKQKQFYAMRVWSYELNKSMVWMPTQMAVKDALYDLMTDEDYGDITAMDIVVTRTGMTMQDTKYSVLAKPPKPFKFAKEIEGQYLRLENLFSGGNPLEEEDEK